MNASYRNLIDLLNKHPNIYKRDGMLLSSEDVLKKMMRQTMKIINSKDEWESIKYSKKAVTLSIMYYGFIDIKDWSIEELNLFFDLFKVEWNKFAKKNGYDEKLPTEFGKERRYIKTFSSLKELIYFDLYREEYNPRNKSKISKVNKKVDEIIKFIKDNRYSSDVWNYFKGDKIATAYYICGETDVMPERYCSMQEFYDLLAVEKNLLAA